MSGIDYSKWDKLNCSTSSSTSSRCDSDDVDEQSAQHTHRSRDGGNKNSNGAPKVTRLKYPSRVTLGPSGVQLASAPPKATASPFAPSLSEPPQRSTVRNEAANANANNGKSLTASNGGVEENLENEDDEDDEDLLYHSLARNGGREGTEYWWSQREDCATVSFLVPWDATAKDVTHFSLSEVQSETSSGPSHAQLDVTVTVAPRRQTSTAQANEEQAPTESVSLRISKQFRYPIKLTDDLVAGCWQLHRMPRRHVRLLVVEVFKEPIGHGMTLWWDRCFVSDTVSVIDTQQIPDRVRGASGAAASGVAAQTKAEEFRKVWDEAHEEFRRRMKERKAKLSQ